jgi:hypothetical protein
MDNEGYVSIDILTSFNRIKNLAQPTSTVLEVSLTAYLLIDKPVKHVIINLLYIVIGI